MKCDELKSYSVVATSETGNYINGEINLAFEAYDADEVDALLAKKDKEIAELKAKIINLKELADGIRCDIEKVKADAAETLALLEERNKQVGELKHSLELASNECCSISERAVKNERRLKRALWLARAERANEIHYMWCQFIYDRKYGIVKFNVKKEWGQNIKQGQTLHTPQGWADVWENVERKCRAKAEEYR